MVQTETARPFGIAGVSIIIATAAWGLNFVITKSATGGEPEQFRIFVYNIIRFPLASSLLFLTARLKGEKLMPGRAIIRDLAMLSFVGIFMYQTLYMTGQSLTSSANIGIIYSFTPLLIVIVSVLTGIERPSVGTVIGVLLGCVGLVLIVFRGGRLSVDIGSALFIVALVCWAVYAVFGKKVLERTTPVVTTAWMLLFGTLYQAPLALWQAGSQSWARLDPLNIVFVIMAAFFSLYLGYTLFYFAISRMGPSKAGVYTNLTPVFTLIFAVLIRGETIRPVQILGLLVIMAGIAITKLPSRRRKE